LPALWTLPPLPLPGLWICPGPCMADGDCKTNGHAPFEPYLSTIAQNVVRNPIRNVVMKEMATPGCLSLAGGRPPQDVFPASVRAWGDQSFTNYGPGLAGGSPELKAWAKEFVASAHSPPGGFVDRDVLITSGNTDGITKAVMLLSDPGDVVLADEVTYPGIGAAALPLGRRVVGVDLDEQGMVPEALEARLCSLKGEASARLLYLVPHGHNPTGVTMTESRKDALYGLARRHALTILEDDAYFYLRLSPRSPELPLEEGSMYGLEDPPRSLLSRDVDGRVVRLDTVSKMLAPGLRLGWVTAGKSLLAKWQVLSEVFTWSISGAQQRAFLDTVKGWGEAGLHRHLQQLQLAYARRRGYLLAACKKHLEGLCRWSAPEFGMFFWLEVPACRDTSKVMEELIESHGISLVPGIYFGAPEGAGDKSCRHFRLSFSQLTEEKADEAMLRLRRFILATLNGCKKRSAEEAALCEPEKGELLDRGS